MNTSINKIVGIKKADFDNLAENGIKLRKARLIPVYKPGDEIALTSVFLSSLRLIKEFKKYFFSEVKLISSGELYVYTEVVFPQFKDSRIDGLIIVVKGGEIKDAAILEMKNKNCLLEQNQIEKYIQIARELNIPKIITVSNEFVSEPTQSPLNIRIPKSIQMFHFSWSYILTLAHHILLFENENNIKDEDQVEIMKEVVAYFENSVTGVCGFSQMKAGWTELVDKMNSGVRLKQADPCVVDTVSSWQQEEKDMALILSRKLGVLVQSGNTKFKGDLKARIENDSKALIENKMLSSTLGVKGAVSEITVKALFEKRIIEMSVKLNVPLDKGVKGQIGWLKRQIDYCGKKRPKIFNKIYDDLKVDINIKHARSDERISYKRIDEIYEDLKSKEINEFGIVQVNDFGKSFSSRKKFVEIIEDMLIEFYGGIVQHLANWEKPAPKISEEKNISEEGNMNTVNEDSCL